MRPETPGLQQLPGLRALWEEAFGDPPSFLDLFFATAFAPERCLCLHRDGQVLAAAYWLPCSYSGGKLAYVYAVATAARARGQGHCRRLLEALHDSLRRQGYAGAVLVPGEPGLIPMYAGMGYAPFGGRAALEAAAAPLPLPLRLLEPDAYCALRNRLLPPGGIRQEGQSLAFLSGMGVRFAGGADWALAFRVEDDRLQGLELLGNTGNAGGIVTALGCCKGCFFTPGDRFFAMYKSLSAASAPTYLGFAFD